MYSGSEDHVGESFVGEPITPKSGTFDTSTMAAGVPGVPNEFTWKGTEYTVAAMLESWKTIGPCKSGSDDKYVRRHYYRVRTSSGDTMVLYCDRQPPRGRSMIKGRWTLYTMIPHAGKNRAPCCD